MNAITDALRRKYKSPAEVCRALGIPQSVLYGRHALDEELEEPKTPAERLHRILKDKLSPEEMKAVSELLEQLAKAEPDDEEEEERADNDDRDPGDEFEEDPAEDGIGENFDPKGMPKNAMDEAARSAFNERFPNAARISTDCAFGFDHSGAPRYRAAGKPFQGLSSAQEADFFERFPNLRRIG